MSVVECARCYYDTHVNKIILEIAQMLSTVIRLMEPYIIITDVDNATTCSRLYKSTHANHPMTKWVGKSRENFEWAVSLAHALNDEWVYRYGHGNRIHASIPIIDYAHRLSKTLVFPMSSFTIPPACVPDNYIKDATTVEGVVESYRSAYIHDKGHLASWRNRDKPSWYTTPDAGQISPIVETVVVDIR